MMELKLTNDWKIIEVREIESEWKMYKPENAPKNLIISLLEVDENEKD